MFKPIIIILVVGIVSISAKPGLIAPVAYSAPLVAAASPVVTATSSQVIARNYNGLAAAPLVAAAPVAYTAVPNVAAYASPYFASPIFI